MCIYWSSMWNFLDNTLYPSNLLVSYFISLGIGYSILIFFFAAETRLVNIAKNLLKHNDFMGLVFEDSIKLIASLATVLIWRGGWGLMKDYMLSDDQWDAWLCHILGIGGLLVLQCGSTLSSISIVVDGERGEGQDINFSVDYFSYLWQQYHSAELPLSIQVIAVNILILYVVM